MPHVGVCDEKFHTILPPHRQDVVGVANVNCLMIGHFIQID